MLRPPSRHPSVAPTSALLAHTEAHAILRSARGCRAGAVALVLVATADSACTPLGIWVYQEPRATASNVAIATDATGSRPVRITFAIDNVNDYDVSVLKVDLALKLDGKVAASGVTDTLAPLSGRNQSALLVAVGAPDVPDAPSAARLGALQPGSHRYAINGSMTIRTPIGDRLVRFKEKGAGSFGT
jgi:hypothetical protein